MKSLPTLRQLQYLVALVELGHFGHAAKRCCVTQSTLSTGIRELEALLDALLIERSKRTVLPTPLGTELAEQARRILGQAAELVETARVEDAPLSGQLNLGVIPTVAPFLLPAMLPTIRDRYPALELFLVEDQSARLLERLNRGELDTVILAFPYDIGRLEHTLFWDENFWVAFAKGHRLSRRKAIGTADLPIDELLLLEEGHCLRDHALAACRMEAFRRHGAFQGTSLHTLIQMVAGGQGVTFLPELALDSEWMNQRGIDVRPLRQKGPHRRLGLVWRATYHRKEGLHLLAESMHRILANRPRLETPG